LNTIQYNIKITFKIKSNQCSAANFFVDRHNLENISGKRILLFSYGSGLASSMFSLRVSDVNCCTPDSTPARMLDSLKDLTKRLDSRQKIDPADFSQMMALRERIHHLGLYYFACF